MFLVLDYWDFEGTCGGVMAVMLGGWLIGGGLVIVEVCN
jgi:hypothetical protein